MRSLFFLLALHLAVPQHTPPCAACPAWNTPQPAFKIYGNTYYIGTHGLASILITSDKGHILIDGALPESVPHIVANIHALGFRVEDIKLILNTHVHVDHAGGLSELQKLSHARVAASPWTAAAMQTGLVPSDDPQFGTIEPIARISPVEILHDGETLHAGALAITAHLTPGHTPGGTSFTWLSCENNRCLNLVYADSLSAISANGFFYTRRKDHLHPDDFERSFAFLETTPCDILLTPHPDASNLWQRLQQRTANPNSLIDPNACRALAQTAKAALADRLASEKP